MQIGQLRRDGLTLFTWLQAVHCTGVCNRGIDDGYKITPTQLGCGQRGFVACAGHATYRIPIPSK